MKMADDYSGVTRLEIDLQSADAHPSDDEKISVSYNHQLASALNHTTTAEAVDNTNVPECSISSQQGASQKLSLAEFSTSVISPSDVSPKSCELTAFNFRMGNSSVTKRTRGRPRKDGPRVAKHHLAPKHHLTQSVASKVYFRRPRMRGRGRPRRDDILHHKIFPGRPRFRGKKFQHYFMSHTPHKPPEIRSNIDIYEDIDSDLKSSCNAPDKILVSPSAIPDNELKIEKFCALCNLSESSLLGQGRLKNFKPTPSFDCFESMKQKFLSCEKTVEVSSESGGELKLFFRKQKSFDSGSEHLKIQKSKSLQNFQEKSSMVTDLIQELEVTGFKSMPESSQIFEPSGELYAHFNCAAWSDGVTKTFEKKLSNVDKAVVAAAFQKCSKCDRYGASVRCCVSECTKIYHYPCAIVSGALQNANCFKIICSIHLEDAFSFGVLCMACHESGDLSQLLLCTSCANYYHGNCMDPPIMPSPDVRAGWQCLDCKVCQNCRQPGDNSKMMVCNTCDKGYHTFCVKPAIASVPKSGWKCSACRMCGDCGARTPGNGPSSRWHMNYSVCDSCYQQRNKGIACPLCGKAYRQFSQRKTMKHCSVCQKYIHEECDRRTGLDTMNYVCPVCAASEVRNLDCSFEVNNLKDICHSSSRDSFLTGNEESLSSADSDCFFDAVSNKISGRRTSASELRRKKPSKSKFKSYSIPGMLGPVSISPKEYKMDDDDPTEDNKMILASATDEFVLCQDLCLMCGSFGKGEEGKLLSCAQCGQCYHIYCANIKVTTVVLKKGWRCLDCTVCEECGQPHDEGRLLLCDECDLSFHTYCLDPPLEEVPTGNWKCKWCVMCIKCGSKSAGINCVWQENYTLCGPCASYVVCCLCQQEYEENELIIQCQRCERWLHGMCDQIDTEDQAEKCADYGYTCPHCRPSDELPPHLLPPPRTPTPEIEPVPEKNESPIAKVKEPEPPVVKTKHPVQYYFDGVCLSESGMQYIKSLVPDLPKKLPRPRKLKQGLLGLITSPDAMKSVSLQQLEKNDDSTSVAGNEESKMESGSVDELALKAYDFDEGKLESSTSKDMDCAGEKKKRPRKLQKLGIGGFIVKPRGRCSSTKESAPDQGEIVGQPCESPFQSEAPMIITENNEFAGTDKPKRKRKPKKKTHLDESFPNYLRDAFFGKELLMSCKKLGKSMEIHDSSDVASENSAGQTKAFSEDHVKRSQPPRETGLATPESKPQEVKDFMGSAGTGSKVDKDVNKTNVIYKSVIKSEIESIKEEHLSSTSNLNSDSSGLPQMDSKDVEDVFQGVIQDRRMSNAVQFRSATVSKNPAAFVMQQAATPQGISQSGLHPSIIQSLQHPDSNSSWPDSECDQSQMQKNILKWESDEHLGLLSTISPVLYANINLPHLKIEYPVWSDRVKQIAKIWRSLPPEKRQPYLQRARENRAASRTQRSNSSDSDKTQKEAKAPEVDPEKQWKQFQTLRQLQQQAQQRIIQEQRVQAAAVKTQTEKVDSSTTVTELEKNIKLFHSKSMSEIPQYPNVALTDDGILSKDARTKSFEKRWSSSAIELNATERVMEENKVKLEVQPSPQQAFVQERISSSLISVARVRPPLEPQLSIPDVSVSPSMIVKASSDTFQSSSPLAQASRAIPQKQSFPPQANSRGTVLLNRTEIVRVATPTIPKETLNTPPPTPRPHSSDSFFQMSVSPQSQLLASLDTHSQPTPARAKLIKAETTFETQQTSGNTADSQGCSNYSPSKSAVSATTISNLQPSLSNSPKAQLPQSVEQFVLQQSPELSSANIVKQLSHHYKESYPPERDAVLVQEKPFDQQNFEHFLQGNRVTISYPNKIDSHQQLRDLLQNKKSGEPVVEERKLSVNEHSSQEVSDSSSSLKLSDVICDTSSSIQTNAPNTNQSFSSSLTSQMTCSETEIQVPLPQDNAQKEYTLLENEKKMEQDVEDVPLPAERDPKDDVVCSESGKKRKTTAGDLVKDLETQQEEHDAIAVGCNLDVLTADVGELELDDDELLGLGNDFNILEYADPELDKSLVGEGEKSNILDEHLDLDDKDEELEDDVIKEQDTQEKDLLPQEISSSDKKDLSVENQKCSDSMEQSKSSHLHETFLDFNKKGLETDMVFENSFKAKNLESCVDSSTVDQVVNTVKEEPKQAFSSCSLSSQTFSPGIDIKLEKSSVETCSIQKTPSMSFNPASQNIAPQHSGIRCSEQILPPPSYRMVTTLKHTLGTHQTQQNATLHPQNKALFPLHINMNIRPDLSLSQQNVIPNVQAKPLLLQEQPLLLEELVEQEKREQRRQTQEGLISPHGDALLSDIDFERLKDDVFSGPPDDSIGGPGTLLGSHEPSLPTAVSPSVGVSSPGVHNFGPPPYSLVWQNQDASVPLASRPLTVMQNLKTKTPVSTVLGPLGSIPASAIAQKNQTIAGNIIPRAFNQSFVSAPTSQTADPNIDPEKLKMINYEKYLSQQHALIISQQKYFETEVSKLRKVKKALNAKQRQLRKNGSELTENDSAELMRVSQEQATLQKQLDQVRKQLKQNSSAMNDYNAKQQKRLQQQPQQVVPRSPLHTSVSSLQSSPQNSQSPLQFSHTAPQSPMMPPSPVCSSNSVRIQHSPSPLMQSPVSMASSSGHQTGGHSPLFSQQIPRQFQMVKSDGKNWVNPVKVSQVQGENVQVTERFQKRELFEKSPNQQTFSLSNTAQSPSESNLKGVNDAKKSPIDDSSVKRYPDEITPASLPMQHTEEHNFTKPEIVQTQNLLLKDSKLDVNPTADSAVPQSILSQSLPSSVSNTLKFTLRQTGMPTVCLPNSDPNVDSASELTYGLPVTEVESKNGETKPKLISDSKMEIEEAERDSELPDTSKMPEANKQPIKIEQISSYEEKQVAHNLRELDHDLNESNSKDPVVADSVEKSQQKSDSKMDQNSATNSSESSASSKDDILITIKREVMDEPQVCTVNSSAENIKTESETLKKDCSDVLMKEKKSDTNEGSSDEELENLSKSLVEGEQEQGQQNVLLKQLLQNCPSAETPRKADNFIELRKEDLEDLGKLEVPFDITDIQSRNKLCDMKSKKPSYLDIRRAQLEKEPTPPPGEKPKPVKRKRPKKKKLEQQGKPDGVLAKKKCRRSSSKVEEGYETYVENLMTKLTNLPPLRILEPNIKPNFNAVPVFGSGDLNVKENQLKGHFGSATIPGQSDIYSFYPYAKEQPSSSAILPPSSPPYRGFYNQEFPNLNKTIEKNETPLILKSNVETESIKISRDSGSPDTVISSSSPESCLFEPLSKYPNLIFVDHLLTESKQNGSPVIPLMYPVPIRLFPKSWNESAICELDDDKDKENIPDDKKEIGLLRTKMTGIGGYSAPLKDSGNVAVTLTLSSAAAEDICGVLAALADVLKIPIPASYEIVERTATPPSQKLGLYRRSKNSDTSIHSLLNGKPRFCRHCDIVVLSAGILKKASDLACMGPEEQEEDEVIFCSTNCYMQFALTHRSTAILEEKEAATVVDHIGDSTHDKSSRNNAEDSMGSLISDEKDFLRSTGDRIKSEIDSCKLESLELSEDNENNEFKIDSSLKEEKLLSPSNSAFNIDLLEKMDISTDMEPVQRKWKSVRYKYWCSNIEMAFKTKRKEDTSEKAPRPFYHTIKPNQMPKDERKCILCHISGDGETNGPARLLNVDVNKWVHLNCALWSAEVYETVNGALMNVEAAYKRSRLINCCICHKHGASLRCFRTRCPNIYHFPCARKEQCSFYSDKTMLCPQHAHRGNPENKLDSFSVFRRVYINREAHKQVANMIQDDKYIMRIGSLIFLNIGQLLPQQIQAFHTSKCIYPVGYRVIRMYWSMRKLGRRSQYVCTINELSGKPEFCIQVKEIDQKDLLLKDRTAKGVWQKVIYPIEKMRKQAKTIKIFPDYITGDDLFGLTEPAVLRIVESLPGVDTLSDYNFRYGRSPFLELPLAINPTGCARSEPKLRTHFKRPHTLHTSNSSRSFHSAFAGMEISSPYIKQFVHSKSSQYRKMKTEWRNNVFLARSRIQGLGLYAARDLEKHTMVIEYIGQLIRNEIAERNEAIYDAQNRGVYMFRLDENRVIDATLCGGLARYMNHSCNPNCVAEVVQIDRENKILIITNRRVTRGEELSYDYKFEVEDDQHKIPCLCGAPNCRKWMN